MDNVMKYHETTNQLQTYTTFIKKNYLNLFQKYVLTITQTIQKYRKSLVNPPNHWIMKVY